MSDVKALAKREENQDIQVLDLNRVKDAMEAFTRFKREILTDPGDYWEDKKQNGKRHVRKPGWEKYAMALNISTDFMDEHSEVIKFNGKEVLTYHFTGVATAPNGRYSKRAGSASSDEGRPWCQTVHGIRAMAQTRAVLRAISALVGGGELAAEELDTQDYMKQEPWKAENLASQMRRTADNEVTSVPQDKGAVIPHENDGNTYEGVGLVKQILIENGFSESWINENLEMTHDAANFRVSVKQLRYLKDEWGKINDVFKAQRGGWVKDEQNNRNNHWEVPV